MPTRNFVNQQDEKNIRLLRDAIGDTLGLRKAIASSIRTD